MTYIVSGGVLYYSLTPAD